MGYESWLERDRLLLLDFDPEVVGIVSQPFWWRAGGGTVIGGLVKRVQPGEVLPCQVDVLSRCEDVT